jgi:hypothetical protein
LYTNIFHPLQFLCNDPDQFLAHYYHFVAELLFGGWAFWSGTFTPSSAFTSRAQARAPHLLATSQLTNTTSFHRLLFSHSTPQGWRDGPGFNAYFLRAAFPSLTVEVEADWYDRVDATPKTIHAARAWHFPLVLLADRSAAFRGEACGSRTQRTAAEAHEAMTATGRLSLAWWEPIRRAVIRFAGGNPEAYKLPVDTPTRVLAAGNLKDKPDVLLPMPERVVVTYTTRQTTRRRLIQEDHEALVIALEELVERKGWELHVVQAERLTKDEQVRLMGVTTVRWCSMLFAFARGFDVLG